LNALEQSPRLQPIADHDLPADLRRLAPGFGLPLRGHALDDVLKQLRTALWIEGELRRSGSGYSLAVRLRRLSVAQPLSSSVFREAPDVIVAAQSAAGWVRAAVGESQASLAMNSSDVAGYTSNVPEALEKYYEALAYHAVPDMAQASEFLETAIRLDPGFAQAHSLLGQTLNGEWRYADAFREIETAMQLANSKKLPDVERVAIESVYYRATEDPVKMVEISRRNLVYRSADPAAQAGLGWAQTNAGQWNDAVGSFQKACNLAPEDWKHVLGLDDALIEAGEFSRALEEYQRALSRGVTNPWIHNVAGAACLALERYDEAANYFSKQPAEESVADMQSVEVMRGRFDVATAAMEVQRTAAHNPVIRHEANEFLCAVHYAAGRLDLARESVRAMTDLPPYPPMARKLAGTISWARRVNDQEALAGAREIAREIADRWPNRLTQAVALHADAAGAWRRDRDLAEKLLLQSSGLAFNIWTIFDLAECFTMRGEWDNAEVAWNAFESRRGTVVVKSWCPVILVLGWLYHAVTAQFRNDRATAQAYSKKVLDHWASSNRNARIVADASNIHIASQRP
jgi:tetratricopeptide (TPR) repeat protein